MKANLAELEEMHLGGTRTERHEHPSIGDAARFQFLKMMLGIFSDEEQELFQNADLNVNNGRVRKSLKTLRDTYYLNGDWIERGATTIEREACLTVCSLGKSSIGQSVLAWWKNYADCYHCEIGTSKNPDGARNKYFSEDDPSWLLLRHRSFKAIVELTRSIIGCRELTQLQTALQKASKEERDIADKIEGLVKDHAQWCSSRGNQLLLAGRNGISQGADATELAAALLIADRLGEAWNEDLEEEAFQVIRDLQRPNGGFTAAAPLYHNRGFAF